MRRIIVKYGLILFAALSAFKFLEFQFFSYRMTLEVYLGLVATAFLAIGFAAASFFFSTRSTDNSALSSELNSGANPESEPSSDSLRPHAEKSDIDQEQLSLFSQREQEILLFLAQGFTNKEIAKGLAISPNTVKTHLSRIFEKLDVGNRTQAVAEAKLLKIIR